MNCPTCDHTMQSVSAGVWWCPRCGTLKTGSLADRVNFEPKSIGYARSLLEGISSGAEVIDDQLSVSVGGIVTAAVALEESVLPHYQRELTDTLARKES